jgi:hypothetical protein
LTEIGYASVKAEEKKMNNKEKSDINRKLKVLITLLKAAIPPSSPIKMISLY